MEQICTTEARSSVFHNVWTITNFGSFQGLQIDSKACHGYSSHDSGYKASWHYVLDLRRFDVERYQFIMIGTPSFSATLSAVVDTCNTALFATVELDQYAPHSHGSYRMSGVCEGGSKIGPITITSPNFKSYFSNGNTVTFRLKVTFQEKPVPEKSQLLENYMSLLSNEQLGDVTILVGPAKFYAQRAILSVRSPVFAAMFQSDMQEAKLNRIVIEDIEQEVFKEVLRFIYVDQVEDLDRMAHELLAAADKYALDRLRSMCEGYLRGHMTQGTVLKTLILADLYHAQELKDQAIRYICQNIKTMQTTDWKSLCCTHPDLAAAILSAISIS